MNLFGFSGMFSGILFGALLIIVAIHGYTSKVNRVFSLLVIVTMWWVWSVYKIAQVDTVSSALFWWRFAHIGVIFMPPIFIHFVYTFLNIAKKRTIFIYYSISIFFLITNATSYFISNVKWVFNAFYYDSPPGLLYTFFVVFFAVGIFHGQFLLFQAYKKSTSLRKKQILTIFIAGIVSYPIGSAAFLPVFGVNIHPGPCTLVTAFYCFAVFYGILKNQLFNVKVIIIELLTATTWMLFSIRLFFIPTKGGFVANIFIMIAVIVLGIFAVRAAMQEFFQKEQLAGLNMELKDLNENLEDKVREQTKEIRRAYEVEKKARHDLEELDKAKTDFILTTQHHLRTPLTIAKAVFSSLQKKQEGDNISNIDVKFIEKGNKATDKLGSLINEFLDISQMEVGKSILNKQQTSVHPFIDEALKELSHEIEQKQLRIEKTFTQESKETTVSMDPKRFRDALLNLIDNAVKYTPKEGKITIQGKIALHPRGKTKIYRLTVTDTGIGMTEEERQKIFTKSFERGAIAKEMNTTGRGIGLMLTKQIIDAHSGTIHAESGGRDKGSVFVVELPV